jgi:hypothetical protein
MSDYYKELVASLRLIESQLKQAECRLNYATDELLIDSIIFEIESLYKKHSYYIMLCRKYNRFNQLNSAGEGYAV